ncbi:RNA-binding domain-containing protein [Methanomassiliicoccus luminyensis]|uniref:RNA-binding domain-containing protein n=2 Tax=Methanomassiliicoccus luminyensis TaxID=1080712 RepID=UPI001F35BA84|nr:RNA-binding domain-containing protein [Methanomassiliicoccus luminyensis]
MARAYLPAMDIGSLAYRTFAHATEDEAKVEQALKFASGAEEIKKSSTVGYHGNPIIVLEARVTDAKGIKAFFSGLPKEDVKDLLDSLEKRVDEESFFFLRLDKQEAYQGRLKLADHEDVIAVRGKVKSYPQNRDNAVAAMSKFLQSVLDRADRMDKKD